jgi:hypothetical protein
MISEGRANLNSYWNPYRVLLDIYEVRQDYAKTLDLLKGLQAIYPNDPGIKARVQQTQERLSAQQPAKPDSTSQGGGGNHG